MYKRYHVVAWLLDGFETHQVYKRDFATIDQAIKCCAGFVEEVSFLCTDRITGTAYSIADIVEQFRKDVNEIDY